MAIAPVMKDGRTSANQAEPDSTVATRLSRVAPITSSDSAFTRRRCTMLAKVTAAGISALPIRARGSDWPISCSRA